MTSGMPMEIWVTNEKYWYDYPVTTAVKYIRADLSENPAPVGVNACDKDPQSCWSVRCQLGKQCAGKARFDDAQLDAEVREAVEWAAAVKECSDIRISGEEFLADDHAKSKHLGSLISVAKEPSGDIAKAIENLKGLTGSRTAQLNEKDIRDVETLIRAATKNMGNK